MVAKNRKNYFLIGVCLLCLVMFVTNCGKTVELPPQDSIPSSVIVQDHEMDEKLHEGQYVLKGNIPYFSIPQDPQKESKVNSLVSECIETEKRKWELSVVENLQQNSLERPAEFWVTYESKYNSKERYSILFFASIDLGGAHPHNYALSLNIDLQAEKILDPSDLFRHSSPYLRSLSTYCKKEIRTVLKKNDSVIDDRWIADGTAPREENYQVICIVPQGLEIIFNPYQVASYADGFQSMVIPFEKVKTILAFQPNRMANP